MKIGIVGLGLIGGSLAKAYKRAGFSVYGQDICRGTTEFAMLSGAVDGELVRENFAECDLLFLAVPPEQAVNWLKENGEYLGESNLVIDCCGTKRKVCEAGFRLAEDYGFHFAGGHPMAGLQYGGFKHSREDLFDGAVFALVPKDPNDLHLLKKIRELLLQAGFKKLVYTAAEEHDRVIAFTSQMAHVVSNAFIKSETAAEENLEISAGSYRDFTRVAYLDAGMWTELFLENRDNLKKEILCLCAELQKYAEALDEPSGETLYRLLDEGRKRKAEVEKKWD